MIIHKFLNSKYEPVVIEANTIEELVKKFSNSDPYFCCDLVKSESGEKIALIYKDGDFSYIPKESSDK